MMTMTCGTPTQPVATGNLGIVTNVVEGDQCPSITSAIIAPDGIASGSTAALAATATDGDPSNSLTVSWGPAGFISGVTTTGTTSSVTSTATYTCPTLTGTASESVALTVTDAHGCVATTTLPVTCNPPAVCRDGIIQPGESCDPPNQGNCGPNCQFVVDPCTVCEKTKCSHPAGLSKTTSDDYARLAGSYEVCFVGTGWPAATSSAAAFCGSPSSDTGLNATAGPAAGKPKTTLCQQLLQCVHHTNCTGGADIDNQAQCYCGAGVPFSQCLMPGFVPSGACDTQIENALEVSVFTSSVGNFKNNCLANGAAFDIYDFCDSNCCVEECLGTSLTGYEDTTFCNAGTVGTPGSGGNSGDSGTTPARG